MKLEMFKAVGAVNEAIAKFNQAKMLFDAMAAKPVFVEDAGKLESIKAAQVLFKRAGNHQLVLQEALKEILDPATPMEDDLKRLIAHATDHTSELSKFLDDIAELVGAQYEVITEALAKAEAAK